MKSVAEQKQNDAESSQQGVPAKQSQDWWSKLRKAAITTERDGLSEDKDLKTKKSSHVIEF